MKPEINGKTGAISSLRDLFATSVHDLHRPAEANTQMSPLVLSCTNKQGVSGEEWECPWGQEGRLSTLPEKALIKPVVLHVSLLVEMATVPAR